MIVNLVTISATCILLLSFRRRILEYAGLLWLSIDINRSAAGAYEAFKDSNRSKAVIHMIKLVIDIILVVGIGRMLHRTGRVPLKLSIPALFLISSAHTYHQYRSSDTTTSIPWIGD